MSELSLSISFNAVRIRIHSRFTYEQVVERLLEQLGRNPVNLEEIAARNPSWESYLGAVVKEVGPGGFMLLGLMDHGAWVSKTGLSESPLAS